MEGQPWAFCEQTLTRAFVCLIFEWLLETQYHSGYFEIWVLGLFSEFCSTFSFQSTCLASNAILLPRKMLFDSISCYMSLLSSLQHADRALIFSLSQWAKMMPCPKPALIGNLQIWHKILVQITQACCATPHPFCLFLILSSVIGIEHVEPLGTNSSIRGNYLHPGWPRVCFWMPN